MRVLWAVLPPPTTMNTPERYRDDNDLVDVQLLNGLKIRVDKWVAEEIEQGIKDRQVQEENEFRWCLSLAPALARSR